MASEKKRPVKSVILGILDYAEDVAWQAAEIAAEKFGLSYRMAFSLLKYLERYSMQYAMNMAHKKGWHRILMTAVEAEALRVAYLMRDAAVEVIAALREVKWRKLEEVMKLVNEVAEKAARDGVTRQRNVIEDAPEKE